MPVRLLPDDLTVSIGHLQRRTDLVGVEAVKRVLGFTFTLIDTGQWRIAARLVHVHVHAALSRLFFKQHPQALPKEVFVFGFAVRY